MQDDVALRIIVSPVEHSGRFAAALADGRVLVESARCPLGVSARLLLAEGHGPCTTLEMQHKGSPIVGMHGQLGKLAGLTVAEGEKNGPVFRQYVPFTGPEAVDSPAPRHGGAQEGPRAVGGHTGSREASQPLARPRLANTRPRLKRREEAA